jgi:hypothetical protein
MRCLNGVTAPRYHVPSANCSSTPVHASVAQVSVPSARGRYPARRLVPSPMAASATVIDTMTRFDGAACHRAGTAPRLPSMAAAMNHTKNHGMTACQRTRRPASWRRATNPSAAIAGMIIVVRVRLTITECTPAACPNAHPVATTEEGVVDRGARPRPEAALAEAQQMAARREDQHRDQVEDEESRHGQGDIDPRRLDHARGGGDRRRTADPGADADERAQVARDPEGAPDQEHPHPALRSPDGYAQVVVVIVRFALAVDCVLAPHAASVSVVVTANQ